MGPGRGLVGLEPCDGVRSGSPPLPAANGPCSCSRAPVADPIGSVVVAALTRTQRGLVSELELTPEHDRVPNACVVNFDNVHTLPRPSFRRRVTLLSPPRMAQACATLRDATGC